METCPKCEAETKYEYVSCGAVAIHKQFECGTRSFNDGELMLGDACKDRQIATLQEKLVDAQAAVGSRDLLITAYEIELENYGKTVMKLRHELADCKVRLELWRVLLQVPDVVKAMNRSAKRTIQALKAKGELP